MSLAIDKRGRLKLSERAIEKQLVEALEAHGWRVLRTNKFNSGNAVVVQGSVEPGIPDLQARKRYVISANRWAIVWIEVKRPGETLNAKQVKWWDIHVDEEKRIATCLEDIEDLL